MALTKVTGSVIKDSVSLSGNVSVGGTLTYQDVTNVDALGIGTFRTGIKVLAGQVDVGSNIKLGNAGVITATSFSGAFTGDVTGTASQVTIANGADNRVLTAASANTLNGESTLTYDGTYLDIGGGVTRFTKQGSYNALEIGYGQNGNQNAFIDLIGDTTYSDYGTRIIRNGQNGANAQTDILHRGTGSLNLQTSDAADIVLKTNGNNVRFRVDSNGNVGVNHNSTQNWGAKFRVGGLLLSDQGAGSPYVFGKLSSAQDFVIGRTDVGGSFNAEHLRIKAGGKFGINQSSPQYSMHMCPASGETRIDLHMTNSTTGHNSNDGVQFGYQNSAGAYIWNFENTDIYFGTTNSARLYIKATTGHVEPNTDNSQNLGASNKRWANIYTGDLQLSNEGKTNVVDGTWGNYTIQEGESNLFLINNRSGKKYKFNLTEVS